MDQVSISISIGPKDIMPSVSLQTDECTSSEFSSQNFHWNAWEEVWAARTHVPLRRFLQSVLWLV